MDVASLRQFVATQLLSAGVDVRTVAGRLGHRNAATTLNVYAHFLAQSDRCRICGHVAAERVAEGAAAVHRRVNVDSTSTESNPAGTP